jgi:MerR family transcriptional regulator, mercuric resistance operon regulatory protein
MDTRQQVTSPQRAPSRFLAIGEVAQASGLTVETIRYYERLGLLARPHRTTAGRRRYLPDVLPRLALIAQGKALGLSLLQVRDLVGQGTRSCTDVHRTVSAHIAALDQKLAELSELRKILVRYKRACAEALASDADPACPTLKDMERSPRQKGRDA